MGKIWRGGDIWDWDGETLTNRSSGSKRYTYDGSKFAPFFGGSAGSFDWDGSTMKPWSGDMRRAVTLQGGDIVPYNGVQEYAWSFTGSTLRPHANWGSMYHVDGNVPAAVAAGFVAAVLNADVDWSGCGEGEAPEAESEPEEGVNRVRMLHCPYVRNQAAATEFVKSGKTMKLPFGCKRNCEWDVIEECPGAHIQCDLCKGPVEQGTRQLHLSCEHEDDLDVCNECKERLEKTQQCKGHPHPLILFTEPMRTRLACNLKGRCTNCQKLDGHGGLCATCDAYLCNTCMHIKSGGDGCTDCVVM